MTRTGIPIALVRQVPLRGVRKEKSTLYINDVSDAGGLKAEKIGGTAEKVAERQYPAATGSFKAHLHPPGAKHAG